MPWLRFRYGDFALRFVLSIGLLTWVFTSQMDWSGFTAVLSSASLPLLGLAFAMRILGLVTSALRWRGLLSSQGTDIPLVRLVESYLISSFFNLILPTRFGGDVFRTLDQRGASQSVARSASVVFVERIFGLYALMGFALAAALFRLPLLSEFPAAAIALAVSVGVVATLGVVLNIPVPSSALGRIFPYWKSRGRLIGAWNTFRGAALSMHLDRRSAVRGLAYSLMLQFNVIIHYWVIGMALGLDIPLIDYFYLIPIQHIILLIPTINGLGVREVGNVFLFRFYGVDATTAVAFGLIDLVMMILFGVAGWLRYVARRRQSAPAAEQEFAAPTIPNRT